MTDLERQAWAATLAAVYVNEMGLGHRKGIQPTPDACKQFSMTAIDVADSIILALRKTYGDSEVVGLTEVGPT